MNSPGVSSTAKCVSARETLAINLIALRHQRGWSQDALALEAGLHRTFIAHVERQARNIAIDNIQKLAVALGVQPFELLKPHRHKPVAARVALPK